MWTLEVVARNAYHEPEEGGCFVPPACVVDSVAPRLKLSRTC